LWFVFRSSKSHDANIPQTLRDRGVVISHLREMDTLVCSLEGRTFQALLNGLSKKIFDGDKLVTFEYLADQLYAGSDLETPEIVAQMKSYEKVRLYQLLLLSLLF
jgi:hypothetical protein